MFCSITSFIKFALRAQVIRVRVHNIKDAKWVDLEKKDVEEEEKEEE